MIMKNVEDSKGVLLGNIKLKVIKEYQTSERLVIRITVLLSL